MTIKSQILIVNCLQKENLFDYRPQYFFVYYLESHGKFDFFLQNLEHIYAIKYLKSMILEND